MLAGILMSGSAQVTLSGGSASDLETAPGTASAGFRINADGTVDREEGGVFTQISVLRDWIRPASAASGDYEVRCTIDSGDGPVNAGTWFALSSDVLFQIVQSGTGTKSGTWTIEIRRNSVIADSGSYTASAQVTV